MSKNIVMGFEFEEKREAIQAKEEMEYILELSKQENLNNPKIALSIYNQLIDEKKLKTLVGMEFLRSLQKELLNCKEIDNNQIKSVLISASEEKEPAVGLRGRRQLVVDSLKKNVQEYKERYTRSLILNFILIVVIIGMFVILEMSGRFDEEALRETIENDYISWEQELKERESEIAKKEQELGIEYEKGGKE